MKKMMLKLIIMQVVVIFCINLLSAAGTSTGEFLKIPSDARGNSLGGAVISESEGLDSLYWNPAGMKSMKKKEIMLSYNKLISDLQYIYLAYGMPLGTNKSAFGIGVTYFDGGKLESLDIFGNPGDTLKSYSIGLTAGFAFGIGSIDLGANIKVFKQQLADLDNMLYGLDIGAKKELVKDKKLNIGVAVKNIGPSGKLKKESDSMPLTIQLGIDYRYISQSHSLKTMLGSDIMLDESPYMNVGVEYGYKKAVYGRVGYKHGLTENPLGFIKGLNTGLGLRMSSLGLDLSWSPMGELGYVIQSTLSMKF